MNKSILKYTICFLLFVLVLCIVYNVYANTHIKLTRYVLNEELENPIRIVQLTDLHNKEFGKENERLINIIINQNPDIVVMTGDMINNNEEDDSVVTNLVRKLSKYVPVYFSMGNHEISYVNRFECDIVSDLKNAGAIVLNYEYKDIVIKGNDVRIGGYYGFYWTPHMITDNVDESEIMNEFSEAFEDTNKFKLLLCHIPTTWLDWNRIDDYPIDLILCGHYHGGQVRIPFVGGLYAPYVGWFPKYTKGLFVGKEANCILSTGLGSEGMIPRINNPPEIVIIDLK